MATTGNPAERDKADDVVVDEVTTATPELVEAMRRLLPQLSSATPPTLAELSDIAAAPASVLLVARKGEGGEIIGSLTLAVFPVPSGLRAWIEDVVVDAAARGRGAGSALVRAALERAAAAGCRTVDLTSRPSRTEANRLYLQLGFHARETNVYRFEWPEDGDD